MIALFPSLRCAVTALFLLAAPFPVCAQPALAEVSPLSAPAVSAVPAENAVAVPAVAAAGVTVPAAEAAEGATAASPPEAADLPPAAVFEALPAPAAPSPAPETERLDRVEEDLRPLLTMLALSADDEQDKDGVEAGAGRLGDFQPFDSSALLTRRGALWLCLSLEDIDDAAPHTLWLDLGRQTPRTRLWMSPDGFRWEDSEPVAQGMYSLRTAGAEGHVLIRMEGMPGPWFSPVLRSPVSAADASERGLNTLFVGLLALLALVDLLLCLAERSEARFWTFVLAAAAAVQSLWPVPSAAFAIGAAALPGIFAAGIALVMLPHVGRVLMRTRLVAPGFDTFFLLLALPGACAALLPLMPGMSWTARLLSLWPLAAVLCFFPAFILLCRGVRGSGSFMLACLAMGGGAVASLCGMGSSASSLLAQALPLGEVLGLLILTAVPCGSMAALPRDRRGRKDAPAHDAAHLKGTFKENGLAALRRTLKGSVEELLDASCRLDQALNRAGLGAEKQDIMEHADSLVAAARRLSEKALDTPPEDMPPEAVSAMFELRTVIQSAFAAVFGEAEKKGLGLAWYVSPHLGRRFKGDSVRLTALLSLLVSDAVRASAGGAVCVRVRRADMSTHPGHLLFTVTDSGEGQPPRGRSSRLLSRVWELAAAHGGDMFVNSGPEGTEIGFSMECTAYEDDGVTERAVPGRVEQGARVVIAASADAVTRQMIPHYLSGMELRVWEARDAAEAASLYSAAPAALVVFDGSLAEDDMIQALASIRMYEGEHSLAAAPFLLLARDALQAERMTKAGCDESLLRPLLRKDLRSMVRWLTAPVGSMPRPELTSRSLTLAALLAGADPGSFRLQRKSGLKSVRMEQGGNGEGAVPVAMHDGAGLTAAPEEERLQTMQDSGAETGLETVQPAADAPAAEYPAEADELSVVAAASAPEQSEHDDGVADCREAVLPRLDEDGSALDDAPALLDAAPEETPDEENGPEADVATFVLPRLDALDEALACLDSPAIRRIAAELAAFAGSCGIRTLADMACGVGEAWEDADVEAAAQIVADMRAETARL
ncbi:hypothetical protein [Mailhella sp.]|uniref:hypothetical protein n=1 Tax=Mailhella sp. TaxID=1981029 RepID=UPI004064472B